MFLSRTKKQFLSKRKQGKYISSPFGNVRKIEGWTRIATSSGVVCGRARVAADCDSGSVSWGMVLGRTQNLNTCSNRPLEMIETLFIPGIRSGLG
jgi:hypothetical protein